MTSSLSRQLASLKSDSGIGAVADLSQGVTTRQSLLTGESGSSLALSAAQVQLLARQGLTNLSKNVRILKAFEDVVFPSDLHGDQGSSMQMDVEEDDIVDAVDKSHLTLENLLVILSPHLLGKDAQFILQFLMNQHQVHVKLDKLLLWVCLPHLQSKLFHRVIQIMLETPTPWLKSFKLACHPATSIGLYRHLASDRGFFDMIAEAYVKLARSHVKFFGSQEGVVYDPLLRAFVQGSIGALELCHNVGEHHTRHLIKAICSSFKADHPEFKAAGGVLFALLVPRVVLNAKSAGKLLQVLSKQHEKSIETLGALAILYRCQRRNLDITAVARELMVHDGQILQTVVNADQMDESDQDFARRMMKALALLLEELSAHESSHFDLIAGLSGLVLEGLKHSCQPDLDTVEILIKTATTSLIKWKQLKKSGQGMEDGDGKSALKRAKKVVNLLKDSHPDAYIRCSVLKPEQDILFMEGEEGGMPSDSEIAVKNLIMNNAFLKVLFEETVDLSDPKFFTNKHRSEVKAENAPVITQLFSSVSPGFLFRQVEAPKLCRLVVNTFHIFETNAQVQEAMMTFLNSAECAENLEFHKQFSALGYGSLAFYVALNSVVPTGDIDISVVAQGTQEFIAVHHQQHPNDVWMELIKPLEVTLKEAKDQSEGHMEYNALVVEKMASSLTPEGLVNLAYSFKATISPTTAQDAATLITCFFISALNKPGKDWSMLASNLVDHLVHVAVHFRPERLGDIDGSKEDLTAILCGSSRYFKKVPAQMFDAALASIRGLPYVDALDEDLNNMRVDLSVVAGLLEDQPDCKEAVTTSRELITKDLSVAAPQYLEAWLLYTLVEENERLDSLDKGGKSIKTKKDLLSFKVKNYNALKYATLLRDNSKAVGRLLSAKPTPQPSLFLLLLAATVSEEVPKKVKKVVFSCLDAAVSGSAANTGLRSLAQHLYESRASIISSRDNTTDVMKGFEDTDLSTSLLNVVLQMGARPHFKNVLKFVKHLDSNADMVSVAEFGIKLLETVPGSMTDDKMDVDEKTDDDVDEKYDEAVEAIELFIEAFLPNVLLHCEDDHCWAFVEHCVKSEVKSYSSGRLVSTLALDIAKANFKAIRFDQEVVLEKWFGLVTQLSGRESEVLLAGRNLLGSISQIVPSKMFIAKLVDTWSNSIAEAPQSSTRITRRQTANCMQGSVDKWKKTFYLLETFLVLEPKFRDGYYMAEEGKAGNYNDLLRPLNNLLKLALADEEGYSNAYAQELVLTCMQRVVDHTGDEDLQCLEDISPELIVQCIRNSKNPDSKATALLILAKASAANAEYVLHNSIPIFTFMGNHFLKAEARSSFDVAVQAIDVIVPHIKAVCLKKSQSVEAGESECRTACLNVVRTFVDASTDMAPHRFKTFMSKLIQKLDQDQYLWIFTALYLKAEGKRRVHTGGGRGEVKTVTVSTADKMQHLLDLYETFPAETQIKSVLVLLERAREDTKELRAFLQIPLGDEAEEAAAPENSSVPALKKASKLSPKDVTDLVRVKVLHFVNGLFGSVAFGQALASAMAPVSVEGKKKPPVNKLLRALMEVSIVNIEQFERKDGGSGTTGKLQRQFAGFSERILERSLSMLPASAFVKVMGDLLTNTMTVVRRKSLEVLNVKFQRPDDPVLGAKQSLDLLDPLVSLAKGKVPEPCHADESSGNQQLALLTLRSMTRAIGSTHPLQFKEASAGLARKSSLKEIGQDNPTVTAATLLCLTDMFQAVGPHAVVSLQPFTQFLIELMSSDGVVRSNPVLLSSIVYTVKTCMENFGGFLNPFYGKLVTSACKLSCMKDDSDNSQHRKSRERLRHLHTAISRGIPTHSLLTIVSGCHSSLASESHLCVIALSNILRDNVAPLDKATALSVSTPFLAYFIDAFKYRKQAAIEDNNGLSQAEITLVEDELIETFMTLSLKMSLDDFKPMFYRLFSDATVTDEGSSCEAVTTAFRVTAALANKLKSLFGFISESLVQKSNTFLTRYSANEFSKVKTGLVSPQRVSRLAKSILGALSAIYTFNRVENLHIKNYEDHVNAILDYLECPIDDGEFESLLGAIKECLGQLAASTDDETPWKYLNYQVLLYIRNNNVKVRMCVLEILEVFVEKKGEGYLSVLPDSVPLLAEALEDDDPKVEAKCKQVIKDMETNFGHSVDHYFE